MRTRAASQAHRAWLCAICAGGLIGSAGGFAASGVRAEDTGPLCVDSRVAVDSALSDEWSVAVRRLCTVLSTWTDADPSAHMRLTPSGRDIILEVDTGDGRAAFRRVHAPEDLELVVEALMTLPSTQREQPVSNVPFAHSSPMLLGDGPVPAAAESNAAPAPAAAPAPVAPSVAARRVSAAPHLPVEIGAALVARVERVPTYLSAGVDVYAGIRPGAWLLALRVRWDALQYLFADTPKQFEMDSVGAGFMIARRALRAGSATADLGFGALLLVETQSLDDGKNGKPKDSDVDVRLSIEPRILLGDSAPQWALSLEAEVSPIRLRRDLSIGPGLPTLPSWGLGVGLGCVWQEP